MTRMIPQTASNLKNLTAILKIAWCLRLKGPPFHGQTLLWVAFGGGTLGHAMSCPSSKIPGPIHNQFLFAPLHRPWKVVRGDKEPGRQAVSLISPSEFVKPGSLLMLTKDFTLVYLDQLEVLANSEHVLLKWYPPVAEPKGLLIRGGHYFYRFARNGSIWRFLEWGQPDTDFLSPFDRNNFDCFWRPPDNVYMQ